MGFSSHIQMKSNNEMLMPFAMKALGLLNKPTKLLHSVFHICTFSVYSSYALT